MDDLTEFQQSAFKLSSLLGVRKDLNFKSMNMEGALNSEGRAFKEYIRMALSDEENGDVNRLALQLVSAWVNN